MLISLKSHKNKDSDTAVQRYKSFFTSEEDRSSPNDLSIYSKISATYNKAVYGLRGEKLSNFLKQEFTRVNTKAEFLSQTSRESPRTHKLRTQLENLKKETRELKRKLDTSLEEIEKLGSELWFSDK